MSAVAGAVVVVAEAVALAYARTLSTINGYCVTQGDAEGCAWAGGMVTAVAQAQVRMAAQTPPAPLAMVVACSLCDGADYGPHMCIPVQSCLAH